MNIALRPVSEFLGGGALSFPINKLAQRYWDAKSSATPFLVQEVANTIISMLSNVILMGCARLFNLRLGYPFLLGGAVYPIIKMGLFLIFPAYRETHIQRAHLGNPQSLPNPPPDPLFFEFLNESVLRKNIFWIEKLYSHLEKTLSMEEFIGFQIQLKEAVLDTKDAQFLTDLIEKIPALGPRFVSSGSDTVILNLLMESTPQDTALMILDFLNPVIPIIDGGTLHGLDEEIEVFQRFREEDRLLQQCNSHRKILEDAIQLSANFTTHVGHKHLSEVLSPDLFQTFHSHFPADNSH